jgi:hypothetical protein
VDGVSAERAAERMDFEQKAALLSKIARAVAYAHDMGVVHRDLKPGNILVDRAGEPKILDFGLAQRRGPNEAASVSVKGTPIYMAPEQFTAPESVGPRTDIHALGLILYELITGARPPEPAQMSDMKAWAERALPLPRELNPNIPEPLQRICLKACERDPKDRYPTANLLADDLDRFTAGQPIAARPKRYLRLLEERVHVHVDDLALWEEEGLITRRERDAMEYRYVKIAMLDSLWVPGARWLRSGPTIAQLGGWLIVVSAILWPMFYWNDLSKWERVAAVGMPTLIVNFVGLLMWKRQQRLLGTIFCAVGAVLVPIFFGVLFSQFDIFLWRQSPDYEVFGSEVCNVQIFVAFLLMLAYSAVLVGTTGLGLFSVLTTVSALFTYTTCLLLLGLKSQFTHEHFAFIACWFLPAIAAFYTVAFRLDGKKEEHFAIGPYVAAGALFIGVTSILALDIPKSWLEIDDWNKRLIATCLLFIAVGLLYFLTAWLHDRSGSRLRRMGGFLFYRLAPPFCVIPIDYLEDPLKRLQNTTLLIPMTSVYLTEVLVLVACLMLLWLAIRFQLRWYLYYGLGHMTVKLVYFTQKHFVGKEYLSWPLAVLLVGVLTMFLGMVIEFRLGRLREKKKHQTPAPP